MPFRLHPGKPLVSVVIPVYNSEGSIEQAVASALGQTYRPIEVLVIDDGSSDRTAEIGRAMPGIRYIRQDNAGPSAARNAGILAATGEFVALLDSDDVWLPTKLEKQMALFAAHPELGLVICDTEIERLRKGETQRFSVFQVKGIDANSLGCTWEVKEPARLLLTELGNFIGTSSLVARTALLREFPFNPHRRYVEDKELWLKLALHTRFGYIQDTCVRMIDHDDGLSSHGHKMVLAWVEVFDAFLAENRERVGLSPAELCALQQQVYHWSGIELSGLGDATNARACYRKALACGFKLRIFLRYLAPWL